jgi:hypothetical protein
VSCEAIKPRQFGAFPRPPHLAEMIAAAETLVSNTLTEGASDLFGSVLRPIVDDNNFVRRVSLSQGALNGFTKAGFRIICGDRDTNSCHNWRGFENLRGLCLLAITTISLLNAVLTEGNIPPRSWIAINRVLSALRLQLLGNALYAARGWITRRLIRLPLLYR